MKKKLPSSKTSNYCPECGNNNLMRDYESAEVVCMGCGFVVVDTITDQGPEWRAFDSGQRAKRERVGAPTTLTMHDKGLSTIIDWQNKDSHGQKIPSAQRAQVYRLRKWQTRIRVSDPTERNLSYALSELSKLSNNLNLPKNVLETASHIYRKIIKKGLIRGRSIQGITAAALYLACRQCKIIRTLDDVSEISPSTKKEIARSYRFLIKNLDFSISPASTSQYISKFSNQLGIQGNAEEIANKILSAAKKRRLTGGRAPAGMAASISYIAWILTGEKRTQREIAEIAKVTEVTIRNRYKELVENLEFVIYV